jgi:hypothetical protein
MCLTTCKKYPEGGFQKRGPKNIIGDWKLSLYEVNGIDSTELINYNGDDKYKNISFNKRQGTNNKNLDCRINDRLSVAIYFNSKNEYINFEVGNITSPVICESIISNKCYKMIFLPEVEGNSSMEWKVIKLTKKEIKLNCNYKNNYTIILIK